MTAKGEENCETGGKSKQFLMRSRRLETVALISITMLKPLPSVQSSFGTSNSKNHHNKKAALWINPNYFSDVVLL